MLIVNKGLEETAKEYLEEYGFKKIILNYGCVLFDADVEKLCKFTYINQLGSKILLVLGENPAPDKKFYTDALSKIPDVISFETFKINVSIDDEELLELAADAVSHLNKTVDLRNPDVIFEIISISGDENTDDENTHNKNKNDEKKYVNKYFCIDFSGESSKRDYKIFHTPASLKGTTAFGFLKMSGYGKVLNGGRKRMVLLDPFCGDGTIIIEAAMYINRISPRRYSKEISFKKFLPEDFSEKIFEDADKDLGSESLPINATDPLMRHVTAARKNAKIAGVEKHINFRRIDSDWLDFKFEEKSIDRIITFLPMKKSYTDLFYNTEYILKKDGMMVILCISKELLKDSEQYFTLKDEKIIYSGSQKMYVLFLGVKK